MSFDRPIFLVGCARSGTTALSSVLYSHPDVGPKLEKYQGTSPQQILSDVFDHKKHLSLSTKLERKELWYWFFGQNRVFADVGNKLIVEEPPTDQQRKEDLSESLTGGRPVKRLLSKSPTNSFRIVAIKKLFPDAKVIFLHRAGADVVASWGKRRYGFTKIGYGEAIDLFSKKWNETNEYLLRVADSVGALHVKYEDLISSPKNEISRVFDHCELFPFPGLEDVSFIDRRGVWEREIPSSFHAYLVSKVSDMNARLGYKNQIMAA